MVTAIGSTPHWTTWEQAALEEGCDIALYGHTHVSQWQRRKRHLRSCPGSAFPPRRKSAFFMVSSDVSSVEVSDQCSSWRQKHGFDRLHFISMQQSTFWTQRSPSYEICHTRRLCPLGMKCAPLFFGIPGIRQSPPAGHSCPLSLQTAAIISTYGEL